MKFTSGDVPSMFVGCLLVALFGIVFSVQYYVRFQAFNFVWVYLVVMSLTEALHIPTHPSKKKFTAIRVLTYTAMIIGVVLCIGSRQSMFDIGATIFVATASVVIENCMTRALSSNEM